MLDATRSVIAVNRYVQATSEMAQTTLRSVLGKADLDMLLSERDELNEALQRIIDEQTDAWGVKVTAVEIKDVEIPGQMQRAMARQAEAERTRRAKVIHAEGEFQASRQLSAAAEVLSANPAAVQLRYLQTLSDIGAQQNTTIVFPLPMDIITPSLQAAGGPEATTPRPEELPASATRTDAPVDAHERPAALASAR